LTTAEKQLIRTFMTDFEKSGIHLPPDSRQRFVELSDEIQLLGRKFLHDVAAAAAPSDGDGDAESTGPGMLAGLTGSSSGSKAMIEIPDADAVLNGMGKPFIEALPKGSRLGGSRLSRFVSPNSWAAQMIIRHAPNERARRIVYEGCNRYSQERVDVLESLLEKRGELASVLDKESWAASVLSDKMAKTPENVMGFLTSLAKHRLPKARADVGLLAALKRMESPSNRETSRINAWDRDYFSERYMAAIAPGSRVHPIHPFFSAGTVIQGLSRLFTNLYGIRFVPCALRPGEAWDKDVRKVQVVDETEGLVGSIYFDLFSRPGKSPNAAHYTVRCSRRIDDDDLPGDRLPPDWDWRAGMTGVENYEGVQVKGKPGRYQLPLVVLTTDFARPSFEDGPSLLAWQEVETLFHEMGHAIHCELEYPCYTMRKRDD
jgi:intermediate peptidase